MPAGVQIINTHGTVLIDDTSPCMQLRAKYPVTLVGAAISNVAVPNCDIPIFALRALTQNKLSYMGWPSSGSSRIVQIAQPTGSIGNLDVVLYHFDRPLPPTSKHGFQVFNSAGECTFDAAGKTAVVVGNTQGPPVDVNAPAGKQYAFCTPAYHRRFFRDHEGSDYTNHHFRNAGMSLANGGVNLRPDSEVVTGVELEDFFDVAVDYLVSTTMIALDVTGY